MSLITRPLTALSNLANRAAERFIYGPRVQTDLPMQDVFTFLTGKPLSFAAGSRYDYTRSTEAVLPHTQGKAVPAHLHISWPAGNNGRFTAFVSNSTPIDNSSAYKQQELAIEGQVRPDGTVRGYFCERDDANITRRRITEAELAQFARCRAALNPAKPAI